MHFAIYPVWLCKMRRGNLVTNGLEPLIGAGLHDFLYPMQFMLDMLYGTPYYPVAARVQHPRVQNMHTGNVIYDLTELVVKVELADRLTFASYAHQRRLFPETSPQRWALIFPNSRQLEKRYQASLRCQACIGSGENTFPCEKEVVSGTDRCEEHPYE